MLPNAVNVNLSNPITCQNRYFSLVRISIGIDRFHCIYSDKVKLKTCSCRLVIGKARGHLLSWSNSLEKWPIKKLLPF